MTPRIRHITAATAIALLAGSCYTSHRSTAVDTDARSWERAAVLTLRNADTLSLHDLRLFLRCDERFAEDTFSVRIAVTTPSVLRYEEPFLIAVPRDTGPAALMREHVVPYRRRIRFAEAGDYRISITPLRPLRGVEAVGIDLVKSE
ncbi:MAG: hypothetical protein K2K30_04585 [Alistipes sp.]|nr:hypothetical protein [Alistipes sp.]MDE6623648.1 hypothetical protein [Alistipes sp.]